MEIIAHQPPPRTQNYRATPAWRSSSSPAVRRAAAAMIDRARSLGTQLDGMLVASEMAGGTEAVPGVHRNVEMGACVMFGMGDVMVELVKDARFAPATLDRDQARATVQGTRFDQLLSVIALDALVALRPPRS